MRAQFTDEETEAQGVEVILPGHATAGAGFEPRSVWGLEETDVPSSSPRRSPKLQLGAEQPPTGECWIPPKKDIPRPRAKEKPKQDSRRGEISFRIKSHTRQ